MNTLDVVRDTFRRILCAPLYVGMLIALVIHAMWGKEMKIQNGVLVTTLKEDSWPMRTWYKQWGGTCFGYGIMLAPNQVPETLIHEFVHTEQKEANTLFGLFTGLIFSITIGLMGAGALSLIPFLSFWILSAYFIYWAGSLIALLRGTKAYRDNHLEKAARGIAGQKV